MQKVQVCVCQSASFSLFPVLKGKLKTLSEVSDWKHFQFVVSRFSLAIYSHLHRPSSNKPSAKDHGHSWTSRFKETLVTFTTLLDPYLLQLSRQEAQGRKKSAETFYCKTVTWAQLVAFQSSYFTTNSIWCGDAVFSLGGGKWLLWCLKCTNEPRHLLWCTKTLLSVQVQLCTVLSRTKLGFSMRQWLLPHNQGKNLVLSSS